MESLTQNFLKEGSGAINSLFWETDHKLNEQSYTLLYTGLGQIPLSCMELNINSLRKSRKPLSRGLPAFLALLERPLKTLRSECNKAPLQYCD